MEEKRPMVVRVDRVEFELDDGRVFLHPIELDEVLSIEEFQEIYDKWRTIFLKDLEQDADV